MIIQIHGSSGIACGFVHYYKIGLVHKKDGTTMFQPFITGIFRYQYLLLTFRLPQSGYGLRGFKIASVQGQGVMYTCWRNQLRSFITSALPA